MSRYILRRILFLVLTLLLTSLIIFTVTQSLPGDVARVVLGREAGEEQLEAFREEFGLNDPLPVQYLNWLTDFVRGDWGRSLSTRSEIFPVVMARLRNSMMLASLTMLIGVPLSIFLGVIAGLNENKLVDNTISIGSLSVVGLPEFVTGIILIEIFARRLGLLPANSSIPIDATFRDAFPMLILPAITATLVLLAYIARMTRAGVLEELKTIMDIEIPPIIVMTGVHDSHEDIKIVREMGASGFLDKSHDPSVAVERIKMVLAEHEGK